MDGSGWIGRQHHWASWALLLYYYYYYEILLLLFFILNFRQTQNPPCTKQQQQHHHALKCFWVGHTCLPMLGNFWTHIIVVAILLDLIKDYEEVSKYFCWCFCSMKYPFHWWLQIFFLQTWIEMKILQQLDHKSLMQYFFPRKLLCHLPSDWSIKQHETCRSCKLHNRPWFQNEFNAKMAASRESRILLQGFGMFCKRCCLQLHSGMCLQV